ncbi:MAG: hypothetical protein HDT14_10355 [Oscillibacter sp.]|nr:hypothetical protein [Oscillibacter sp.]
MRKWILSFTLALVTCLGLTVTALAAGDPADVSEPNYYTGAQNDSVFSAFVDADHTLWAKGDNTYGSVGNGTLEASKTYVKVMDHAASVSYIAGSVAAVKTDGSLWTWGSNDNARLGYEGGIERQDYSTSQPTPRKVMDGVAAASATYQGVLAIKTDGSLWLLAKEHKKIADNVIYATEVQSDIGYITADHHLWMWNAKDGVTDMFGDVKAIGGTNYSFFVLTTDSILWGWGDNFFYQMGNGTRTDADEWVKIMDSVASFSLLDEGVGAVKTNGELWVWGTNDRISDKEVYYGLTEVSCQSVPVKVSDNVKKAAVGGYYAIKPDGSVHTWRYEHKSVNMVQWGFYDSRLTDIVTPMAASSGTAGRFEDVRTDDYFYDAVNWAVEKGIASGKSETRFAPYDTCTIGDAMIFLWRIAGQPEPTIDPRSRWNGLEEGDYRYKPYNWSLNTVYDFTLRQFGTSTGARCTRLLIVNMLWRLAGRPEPAEIQEPFRYTDVNWDDSSTAKAVAWAVEKNLVSGTGDGTTFSPNELCTRAQVVSLLYQAFAG